MAGPEFAAAVPPDARQGTRHNMLRASGCHASVVGKGGDDYLDGRDANDVLQSATGTPLDITLRGKEDRGLRKSFPGTEPRMLCVTSWDAMVSTDFLKLIT